MRIRGKNYPINVLPWQLPETLLVAAAPIVSQESHFWTRLRTEGKELFAFFFSTKEFRFESIAMHDLEEIQFLEFMGGSNSTMPTQII